MWICVKLYVKANTLSCTGHFKPLLLSIHLSLPCLLAAGCSQVGDSDYLSRLSLIQACPVGCFKMQKVKISRWRWKSWKSEAREKVKSQKISYVILVLCASLMVRKPRGTEQCGFSCCKPLLGRQLHTWPNDGVQLEGVIKPGKPFVCFFFI